MEAEKRGSFEKWRLKERTAGEMETEKRKVGKWRLKQRKVNGSRG